MLKHAPKGEKMYTEDFAMRPEKLVTKSLCDTVSLPPLQREGRKLGCTEPGPVQALAFPSKYCSTSSSVLPLVSGRNNAAVRRYTTVKPAKSRNICV